jgi:Holliday junction resolvase
VADPVNGRAQYRRGKRFEDRAGLDLLENGYFVVRAGGSRGVADLVAVKHGQVLLVQCKISGSLAPEPWNALYDAAAGCGAVPVMAEKDAPGSLRYWRLERRKDGRGGRQPMTLFLIDEVAGAIR